MRSGDTDIDSGVHLLRACVLNEIDAVDPEGAGFEVVSAAGTSFCVSLNVDSHGLLNKKHLASAGRNGSADKHVLTNR